MKIFSYSFLLLLVLVFSCKKDNSLDPDDLEGQYCGDATGYYYIESAETNSMVLKISDFTEITFYVSGSLLIIPRQTVEFTRYSPGGSRYSEPEILEGSGIYDPITKSVVFNIYYEEYESDYTLYLNNYDYIPVLGTYISDEVPGDSLIIHEDSTSDSLLVSVHSNENQYVNSGITFKVLKTSCILRSRTPVNDTCYLSVKLEFPDNRVWLNLSVMIPYDVIGWQELYSYRFVGGLSEN